MCMDEEEWEEIQGEEGVGVDKLGSEERERARGMVREID